MNRNRGVPRLSVLIMILALTILACQGVGSFNPFATATPTPTATFTPTVTPSPTPTYTPTNTPTATPLPTGRIKEEQPDGTTLFTDYDGGYQLTFPQNWTAIILEKDDINNALNQLPKQEQGVSDMIESLKRADINSLIRVISFNFKAQQGLYTPNINIAYDTNPLLSALPLKDIVDATAALFPSLKIKLVNSEIKKTSSGIDIGVIESQWTMNTTNGQKINLHQKQIYFKSGEGVVAITFSTVKNATVDLSSDLEKLIESIQLLDE